MLVPLQFSILLTLASQILVVSVVQYAESVSVVAHMNASLSEVFSGITGDATVFLYVGMTPFVMALLVEAAMDDTIEFIGEFS